MVFSIDKDVPFPKHLRGRWKEVPLGNMEVNDSILINTQDKKEYLSLAAYISRFNKSHAPKQFKMRTLPTEEGVRIFRLEDLPQEELGDEDNQQVQSAPASGSRTVTGELYARGERQVGDPVDRESSPADTEPTAL
jgi:hypothetical protein